MSLSFQLRNKSVRELIAALEKDGFVCVRKTQTGGHIYKHADGRITNIHVHKLSDTVPQGTLGQIMKAIRWTEEDAKRLGLLPK